MSIDVRKIDDLELLREVAHSLLLENDRLHGRLSKLANRLDALEGKDSGQLQQEVDGLKRQLTREKQKHSQVRSERRRPHQRKRSKPPKPQSGGTRNLQPRLPHIDAEYNLAESRRACPGCGSIAAAMKGQSENGELVTVVRREFRLMSYRRQKYVHACNCTSRPQIVTAPGPRKLVPGGRYSIPLAASVALAKYHDHTPLERQAAQMRRDGLNI